MSSISWSEDAYEMIADIIIISYVSSDHDITDIIIISYTSSDHAIAMVRRRNV
jgi:hypothetical protein